MKDRKMIILAVSLTLITIILAFVTYKPQAQEPARIIQQNDLPTVDFGNLRSVEPSTERRIKNLRYNTSSAARKIREDRNDTEVRYMHPRFDKLPAVPLPMSDLVLIGTVTEASAFVSDDESNVYSEFFVTPREILFLKPPLQFLPSDKIFVSREGGNVRFSSRRILTYSAKGQGSLKPKGTYILFLEKTELERDFTLITAYQILNNAVYPVDVGEKFDIYRNLPISEFLSRLKM